MAKDLGPHVVARAAKGVAEGAPSRRQVEARPTCKLDRNELLGLVKSSTAEPVPRRSKRQTDLDVSVEVITAETTPGPMPKARTVRVVQTVRRTNVAKSGIEPLRVAPTGSDVSMPVTPVAKVTRNDSTDPFADMFAETLGAEPPPAKVRAATGSGTHAPVEPEAQDIPTEVPATDFDAFGDTAMLAAPLEVAAPLADGSIVAPPVAPPAPMMLRSLSIDDTAPAQALVDALLAVPEPVVAEPVTTPVVAAPQKPSFAARVRKSWSPSLVQQIAIGVVLGCVGVGVYLGIAAT